MITKILNWISAPPLVLIGTHLSAAAIDMVQEETKNGYHPFVIAEDIHAPWEAQSPKIMGLENDPAVFDGIFLGYGVPVPSDHEQTLPRKKTIKKIKRSDIVRVYVIPLMTRRTFSEKVFSCGRVLPVYPTEQHVFSLNSHYYGEKTIWGTMPQYHLHPRELLTFYDGIPRLEDEVRYVLNTKFDLIIESWGPFIGKI